MSIFHQQKIDMERKMIRGYEAEQNVTLQNGVISLEEVILEGDVYHMNHMEISYDQLDRYIEVFSVLANAKRLGIDLTHEVIYRYPFQGGGDMIGIIDGGELLCLYHIYQDVPYMAYIGKKIEILALEMDIWTLNYEDTIMYLGDRATHEKKKVEVWPPIID